MANEFLLKCSCGQRSYIEPYSFNRPGALEYGTPYSCPKCGKPLGSANFMFPERDTAFVREEAQHGR